MTIAATVPSIYRGLWRRRVLATQDRVDRTTKVLWLQSASLFVDLRVPENRHPDDPLSLAMQQGFAGRLNVDGDVLTWHRWLDFQPPGEPDVGRVTFHGDLMIEHGVLSEYYEEWERVAPWPADGIALSLEIELDAHGRASRRAGVILAGGGHFAYALHRAAPLPAATSLCELIEEPAHTAAAKARWLDCVIEFGQCSKHSWRVDGSTRPAHEGQTFGALHGTWSVDGPAHYAQLQEDGIFRRWHVIEGSTAFEFPGETRLR